ncbi:MAG: response regulator receiver protein [Chloroflexi bacterium]|jgi:CheY-like chemotaxis protein|nr:response regulator receiver protein [Chloroflexota bacterium]
MSNPVPVVILIADDEASLRFLIHETIAEPGLQILEAQDGLETLCLARTHHPKMILLDVAMPALSGVEVCQQLKADPATRDIQIVMLTAHSQTKDREAAFAAGADYFITKPFSPTQLFELVDKII